MRNDFCENYLMHKDRANHKYVAKVKLPNGKFYYFYNLTQYQNYMSRGNKQSSQKNYLKNPNKQEASDSVKKQMSGDKAVQTLVSQKTPGNTVSEKVQYLRDTINKGKNKVASLLNSEASAEETSKSSKKSSGSSGSSGKKSKTGSGAGSKGSGSSKSGSGSSKEKSGASKAAKAAKESTSKTAQKKAADNTPINMDTLKKTFGTKDEDVSKFEGSASDFKNNMLKKYDDGSFGYLSAGNTTYKWEISGGELILKDYDTGKEVSFDTYLKDAKNFEEFQTNKKKK